MLIKELNAFRVRIYPYSKLRAMQYISMSGHILINPDKILMQISVLSNSSRQSQFFSIGLITVTNPKFKKYVLHVDTKWVVQQNQVNQIDLFVLPPSHNKHMLLIYLDHLLIYQTAFIFHQTEQVVFMHPCVPPTVIELPFLFNLQMCNRYVQNLTIKA